MIPSPEQCYELMAHYRMLDNIKAHSIMVARVARLLAGNLAGTELDMDLVIAGALLHDIAKTQCLYSNRSHALEGEEIVLRHGFDELAEIVAEHVVLGRTTPGIIVEKQIVYYADKRINHDQVVSLEERLAYILDRYGRDNPTRHEMIMINFVKCQALEKEIFSYLSFAPADVKRLLENDGELYG